METQMLNNNWRGPLMAFTSLHDKSALYLRAFDIVAVWTADGDGVKDAKIRTTSNITYSVVDTPEEIADRLFTLEAALLDRTLPYAEKKGGT